MLWLPNNVAASKTLQLWNALDVLLLSLKRFHCINGVTTKLDMFVELSVQGCDISHYILPSQVNGITHRLWCIDASKSLTFTQCCSTFVHSCTTIALQRCTICSLKFVCMLPLHLTCYAYHATCLQPRSLTHSLSQRSLKHYLAPDTVVGMLQTHPHVYDLYALVNHTGSPTGRHYTAHCKIADGSWHCFNDTVVEATDLEHVVSPAAYILLQGSTGAGGGAGAGGASLQLAAAWPFLAATVRLHWGPATWLIVSPVGRMCNKRTQSSCSAANSALLSSLWHCDDNPLCSGRLHSLDLYS